VAQYREIEKSEFLRSKEMGHQKSRNTDRIGTAHPVGRVATIGIIGKSRQGVNPSTFGVHRDIGDPSDKWFVHFEITIRETPISGGQPSAQWG
jgi:hypothetical protein